MCVVEPPLRVGADLPAPKPPPPDLAARDRLWCEALIAVLAADSMSTMEAILSEFNRLRRERGC